MSVKTTYVCDNCGAIKGETNHWWAVAKLSSSIHIRTIARAEDEDMHLCGEACVTAAVSKALREIGQ